ncbi:histidine phosphatase family protein [Microbispora sp. NPDC088329]|uniref:histidine phosphatase family protein n=1 Tax=Microbispora sp. NPDC088329 TaxID=3154869 RepID=UPI00342F702B
MSDGVRVWCLRHAESENVTAGLAGAVPAAPLTARGREQAAVAARVLAGEPITGVYCSTALRARQTAEILTFTPGVTIVEMPELAEVGIGRHEGTTDPAVHDLTAEVLRAWVVDHDLERKVADGETGHEVVGRMTAAFRVIARAHPGETVAVVGHVASLTAALTTLCRLGADVWGAPLPHAVPFAVGWDGEDWHCPAWPGTRLVPFTDM